MLSTIVRTRLGLVTTNAFQRAISTSAVLRDSFNIQDKDDFAKRVLNNKKPVIVDFHATWCAPCRLLAPRLEGVVGKKNDKVDLAKVDIDDNESLAMEYKVKSVPTVIAMKNGKKVAEFVGVKEEDQLDAFVEKLIN